MCIAPVRLLTEGTEQKDPEKTDVKVFIQKKQEEQSAS
jgi:hypothetical protein